MRLTSLSYAGGRVVSGRHEWRAVTLIALTLMAALMATPAGAQTAPSNDLVSNATAAGVPDVLVVDTRSATVEADEPVPSCAPPGTAPIRRTVWYSVVPRGTVLRVSTSGSSTSYRPILALYTRDATGRLAQVACGNQLALSANVTGGLTYYLQVGGADLYGNDDGGQLSLVVGPVTGGISAVGNDAADLIAGLADTPDPVTPGADLTYAATVTNVGPDTALTLTATIAPASGLTFRSISTPPAWSCTTPDVGVGGPITCMRSSMAPGESAQIGVVSRVEPGLANGALLTTTLHVSAGTPDPVSSNNAAAVQTTVSTPAGLPPPPPPPPHPPPSLCSPRPNVGVQARQIGPGQLAITIRSATSPGTSVNALSEVAVTAVTNAVIDVPNGVQGAAGTLTLPVRAGAQEMQFTLRRPAPGPFRADLIVTDACGPWRTFVGGGVGVP